MQHSHFFKKDRTKVSPYPWIRRTTQPAFWPAARLRRTSVSAAGGNLGAEQIYFARAFEIPKGGGRLRRPEPKKKDTLLACLSFWCERRDLNPHGSYSASTSSWCVCRFRHSGLANIIMQNKLLWQPISKRLSTSYIVFCALAKTRLSVFPYNGKIKYSSIYELF